MNTDADALTIRRKATARVVCLVAAVCVILPCLGFRWLKAPKPYDAGLSLFDASECHRGWEGEQVCESKSNLTIAEGMRKNDVGLGTFAYAGWATFVVSIVSGLSLAAAGGLAFKDRFVREPIALTTVALIGLVLALITACVFIGSKPSMSVGVAWPFFLYGTGVVAGIAGAQMLAKAFSDVRDPYWDGLDQNPGT